jgi:hypothetical protein
MQRVVITLLACMMLTLPLMVAIRLQASDHRSPAARGDQPGGMIRGSVLGQEGQPVPGHSVELWALGPAYGKLAEAQTDALGAFVFDAPPVQDAAYRLRAGGGVWRWQSHEIGFLKNGGEPADQVVEQDFELQPGAVLLLEMSSSAGHPVSGAVIHIKGVCIETGFLRLAPRSFEETRTFATSPIAFDGLPPLEGRVSATLNGGRVISFDVELPVGQTTKHIQL